MKKATILFFTLLFLHIGIQAQNWPSTGGNNQRNGVSEMTGPDNITTPKWFINNSSTSVWGNGVFTYGKRFVTSRTVLSPVYKGLIECRSTEDGSLLWVQSLYADSRLYALGFTHDAVYIQDYNTDSLYALNTEDGSVLWSAEVRSSHFGGKNGILFACNGDPIVNAPNGESYYTMRLDKNTGQVIWTNNEVVPIMPTTGYGIYQNKIFKYTGTIMTDIRIVAIDIDSGITLYKSDTLSGEPDQEIPLSISPDGLIYGQRDGGDLFAIADTGGGFEVKWTYTPTNGGMGTYGNISFDANGNLYFADGTHIKHIDKITGQPIDSSINIITTAPLKAYITVDKEGTVYVSNSSSTDGKYYAFSPDLQTVIWEQSIQKNYYAGPVLANEGTLLMIGSGSNIIAYGYDNADIGPVADFMVSSLQIETNEPVDFTDLSSYQPVSWEWFFPGADPSVASTQNPTGIIYDTPGTYSVFLKVANSFGADSIEKACLINVEQGQIHVEKNDFDVRIYLNYTQNKLFFESDLTGTQQASIYSIDGRLVNRTRLTCNPGETQEIKLRASMQEGIYIFSLSDAGGKIIHSEVFFYQ